MKFFTFSFLTAAALIFANNEAKAQTRNIDLSLESINAPTEGAIIAQGATLSLDLTIKHNGPDTLRQGDTIVITGGPFPSGQGASAVLSQGVPVGQSFTLSSQSSIFTNNRTESTDENTQWCFTVHTAQAASQGSDAFDNDTSNNQKCVNFVLKGNTTSVKNIKKNADIAVVFPNPVKGTLNIEYKSDNKVGLTINVTDVLGRKVISQNLGQQQAGTSTHKIDVSALSKGAYFVEILATDGKRAFNKIVVE